MHAAKWAGVVSNLLSAFLVCGICHAQSIDGVGAQAIFNEPWGITIDRSDNLYVADARNYAIRKITPESVVTTIKGKDVATQFFMPIAAATDLFGNVYVIDSEKIKKIAPSGDVTLFAQGFAAPHSLATDRAGNIYVTEGIGRIRKITPAGVIATLFTGEREKDGSLRHYDGDEVQRYFDPSGIAVDNTGTIYVADRINCLIRKITPAGVMTTLAGVAGQPGDNDGTANTARFNEPAGVATDNEGNVYVADTGNGAIRKITPAGVVTTVPGGRGLSVPWAVAVDRAGNLYVADMTVNAIRKITPDGKVTAFAGQLPKADATLSDTLCHYDERVIFSCRLNGKGNKIASVCGSRIITATRGYMQYRYGKPGAVELALPEKPEAPYSAFTAEKGSFAGGTWFRSLSVNNGVYSYTVFGYVGMGDQPSGVTVEKEGKAIANKECEDEARPPDVDFYEAGIPFNSQ